VAGKTRAAEFGHEGDQVFRPVHRFDGTQAEAGEGGLLKELADQGGEGARRYFPGKIAAPAAQVDSGEDEFVAASSEEALDLVKYGGGGQAARGAASVGYYSEGAAIGAAFLDFEVGASLRAGSELGFFGEGVGEAVVGPDGGGESGNGN